MRVSNDSRSTVSHWISVLDSAHRAAEAMSAESDEQFQLLADLEAAAAQPNTWSEALSQIDINMRSFENHFKAAQETALKAEQNVHGVENDLRTWRHRLTAIRDRLAAAPFN